MLRKSGPYINTKTSTRVSTEASIYIASADSHVRPPSARFEFGTHGNRSERLYLATRTSAVRDRSPWCRELVKYRKLLPYA